jgi:hypothetical protein
LHAIAVELGLVAPVIAVGRALTSNVLLNKTWPLQLAEVSKGAAYGRGVRGWWHGGRIIEKLGLDAEVSGATR